MQTIKGLFMILVEGATNTDWWFWKIRYPLSLFVDLTIIIIWPFSHQTVGIATSLHTEHEEDPNNIFITKVL